MATCIVQLDNFQGQYYAGNTIIGKVICSFSKPINIRGVKVILKGKEHTQWSQTVTHFDKNILEPITNTVPVTGTNNVLDVVTTLTGEGTYQANRYEYPFTFFLPKNLPATYKGTHGWIKYSIKGTIVIPFGIDYYDVKEFNVIAPIDFNETPGLQMEPVTQTAEKNVWWLFRSCGLITMKTHVEKAAFVQGEVAKVRLQVTNMSTENVERVEAKMEMVIESHSTFPSKESKTDYEVLAVASDTGVGAHGERTYVFDLIVPESTMVPNFSTSKLFRQSAKIDVMVVPKGFHSDMILTVPIQLGNIPVRRVEHFPDTRYPPASPCGPTQVPFSSPGGVPPPPFSTMASQPNISSRELPPPYSPMAASDHLQGTEPSRIYPVIPQYTSNPSSPASTLPQKAPSDASTFHPSAPPKEDLDSDDEFVLC